MGSNLDRLLLSTIFCAGCAFIGFTASVVATNASLPPQRGNQNSGIRLRSDDFGLAAVRGGTLIALLAGSLIARNIAKRSKAIDSMEPTERDCEYRKIQLNMLRYSGILSIVLSLATASFVMLFYFSLPKVNPRSIFQRQEILLGLHLFGMLFPLIPISITLTNPTVFTLSKWINIQRLVLRVALPLQTLILSVLLFWAIYGSKRWLTYPLVAVLETSTWTLLGFAALSFGRTEESSNKFALSSFVLISAGCLQLVAMVSMLFSSNQSKSEIPQNIFLISWVFIFVGALVLGLACMETARKAQPSYRSDQIGSPG